ncbi:MAG: ATP-binding protein, partial [Pseudomonadota bacterium]
GAFMTAGYRLYRRVLQPLVILEEAVASICQGTPDSASRLAARKSGVLEEIVRDIDSLNAELSELYEDMDNRVARQTRRLAQKNASLKILYDVAASINRAEDLGELLTRYLHILREMVNGTSAAARIRNPEGTLVLTACIAPDGGLRRNHELLPLLLCHCGRTLNPADILCDRDPVLCSRRNHRTMFGAAEIERIEVPLEHQAENLGYYEIFLPQPGIAEREDIRQLLTTIGNHLGMAVAKHRSDEEARRLSIHEERNDLAHELHDSLAQTLASLRFQVRMLEETLETEGCAEAVIREAQRLHHGVEEAHAELRELLSGIRLEAHQQGLIPALERLAGRYREEWGIPVFFQKDCRQVKLSPMEEVQILRIVQEALTNIRKHAEARTVRVLLRCRAPDVYLLLVEDDGKGFEAAPNGKPGEHIGLAIMRERARRLRGKLRIESELGEGTRVELNFSPGRPLPPTHEGGKR